MAVTTGDVLRLAAMVRLGLTEVEAQQLTRDMDDILAHVDRLQLVDTSSVDFDARRRDGENVTRPDEVTPSLPVDDVLANAPERHEHFFVVPAVLGE